MHYLTKSLTLGRAVSASHSVDAVQYIGHKLQFIDESCISAVVIPLLYGGG
jgi:hypothetical protein